MSRIFLSHSSADEIEAVALKQWLTENGWDDVLFLDVDPNAVSWPASAGRLFLRDRKSKRDRDRHGSSTMPTIW